MRSILLTISILIFLKVSAQETVSPKPGITVNGYPCLILNLSASCLPRTCDSLVILAGDSIEFCTYQEIDLNVDTAYWLQWNFYGATNLADTIHYGFPNQVPICHSPRWDSSGTYIVEVFYNGWLSAYPSSDCYQQGPSRWFIKVVVLPNPNGIEEEFAGEIIIAPNPSSGKFTLLNVTSTSQVTITDVVGRVLFQTNESEIDLTAYGAGMYFAEVSSENSIANYTLIVQ